MAIFRRKIMAVAVKIQASEGTDSVPDQSVDAIRLVGIPTIKISPAESGDRTDVQHGGMGALGRATPAGKRISTEITVEIFGKGTAYSALPASAAEFQHDPLLRGAGCSRAYAAGKVVYTTLDTGLETFSMYVWSVDGMLHKCIDCVAKPKISLVANRPGTITYAIEGRLKEEPAVAVLSGLVLPTVMPGNWGTGATTLDSFSTADGALVPRKLDVDFGIQTTERPWAGAGGHKGYVIVDRLMRLSMEIEPPSNPDFAYSRAIHPGIPGILQSVVTTSIAGGTGNTIAMTTGMWAIEYPDHADFGGLAGHSLQGALVARSIGSGDGAGREFALSIT